MTERSSGAPLSQPETFAIAISDASGAFLCGLRCDGTLKLGPNYQPDETARIFWEAMAKHIPPTLRSERAATEEKISELVDALSQFALQADSMMTLNDRERVCGVEVSHYRTAAKLVRQHRERNDKQ